MKAVRIHAHGGVEQLRYEDAPEPELAAPTEVIVRLKNAAVNHVDIWNRLGEAAIPIPLPHILGADGAGIVVEVGSEASHVKPGDPVCLYPFTGCGQCEYCLTDRDFMCIHVIALGQRLEGTYAEYVKLPAENCFPIPAGLSFAEAAASPALHCKLSNGSALASLPLPAAMKSSSRLACSGPSTASIIGAPILPRR